MDKSNKTSFVSSVITKSYQVQGGGCGGNMLKGIFIHVFIMNGDDSEGVILHNTRQRQTTVGSKMLLWFSVVCFGVRVSVSFHPT